MIINKTQVNKIVYRPPEKGSSPQDKTSSTNNNTSSSKPHTQQRQTVTLKQNEVKTIPKPTTSINNNLSTNTADTPSHFLQRAIQNHYYGGHIGLPRLIY